MTHDEMIAVIEHHKNGGKVDVKLKENRNWTTCKDDPEWCFDCYDYRAKPEPQVIYADFDDNGDSRFCSNKKYTPPFGRKLRKFVEVEE